MTGSVPCQGEVLAKHNREEKLNYKAKEGGAGGA